MSEEDNFVDLTIVSGHFNQNHATVGNMDPYVAFEYNGSMFKTSVAKGAGNNATFNERFRLHPIVEPNELFL